MPQTSLTAWLQQPDSALGPAALAKDEATRPSSPRLASSQSVRDTSSRLAQDVVHLPLVNNPARGSTKTAAVPPNVTLRPARPEDIPSLKRMNHLLLPIPYPETFYREIVQDPSTAELTRLAFWNDQPVTAALTQNEHEGRLVAAINCRILPRSGTAVPAVRELDGSLPSMEGLPMLYISTLTVLAPYRTRGLARQLLSEVESCAANKYGCKQVGAHVWEANQDGLEWYYKAGFVVVARQQGYYRKLVPMGAVVMQKSIEALT